MVSYWIRSLLGFGFAFSATYDDFKTFLYLLFVCLVRWKLDEWPQSPETLLQQIRFLCLLCEMEGACWFGIDELSLEPPWPLIQSVCLHVHCFLALIYYRVQAMVCAVTTWIKLCHSHFAAAVILFSGCSEMLRGEDISLICQVWSLYLNVDWVRQDEGQLDFLVHTQRHKGHRDYNRIG